MWLPSIHGDFTAEATACSNWIFLTDVVRRMGCFRAMRVPGEHDDARVITIISVVITLKKGR